MISLQNNISLDNWKPYPTKTEWLSSVRLIIPIASGVYGRPSNQVILISNHQPSLVHLATMEGMTSFALEGGGFPVEVAVAFGLINSPQGSFFQEYIDFIGGDVTFYIPTSLSLAWNWKDGDAHLGGTIRVISDTSLDSPICKLPVVMIRLYAAVRLALAQMILLFFPIMIMNPQAFIPVVIILFTGSCLIAGFWDYLPGNGWWKGGAIGVVFAILAAMISFFQVFPLPPLFLIGIFLLIYWIGGLFMGGRSSS